MEHLQKLNATTTYLGRCMSSAFKATNFVGIRTFNLLAKSSLMTVKRKLLNIVWLGQFCYNAYYGIVDVIHPKSWLVVLALYNIILVSFTYP